jgi:hypothetical protein
MGVSGQLHATVCLPPCKDPRYPLDGQNGPKSVLTLCKRETSLPGIETQVRVAYIFFFGATAPIWALAYLHETLRFTLVF